MASAAGILTQYSLIAIALCILAIAAVIGFYLFRNSAWGEASGLFTPRSRRLSFVERASLEGGRKLLLIRRDDVEHLVMIGGPIDIVVETGIKSPFAQIKPHEGDYRETGYYPAMQQGEEEALELTQLHLAKTS